MSIVQKSLLRVFVLAVVVIALPVAAFAQQRRAAGTPGAPSSPVTVTNTPLPTTVTNTANVNVANTPTVNVGRMVPVTGTVEISNAPNVYVANRPGANTAVAVNAAQSGPWNVTVTGMPASSGNVTVVNPNPIPVSGTVSLSSGVNANVVNTDPIPVRLVTTQPFHKTFSILSQAPGIQVYEIYQAPTDKRVVIEYASVALLNCPPNEVVAVALRTTLGPGAGEPGDHYIPILQSGVSGALYPVQVGGGSMRLYANAANPGAIVRAVVDNHAQAIWTGAIQISISGHLE